LAKVTYFFRLILSIHLKDYLIQQKILESKFEKDFLWLQILEERGLAHQNYLQLEKLKKGGEGIQNIWASNEQLKVYHYEFFRNDFQKHTPHIDNLQKGIEYLEEFYRSIKLKFAAEIINRKSLLPEQNHNPDLDIFVPDLEKINFEQLSENSELYIALIQFLKKRNLKSYQRLEKFLAINHTKLHQDEKLTTIIYMLNYLAGEIKGGNSKMMNNVFELYSFGLENKILIHNGKIDALPFNNIVTVACFLKKYDWAKRFVEDYKIFVKDNIRNEVSSLSLLMILFKEEKFKKVSPIFTEIKFTNVISKITGTIFHLASLYELGDYDNLYTPLDTFISYLNNNKMVGKNNKEAALNFARILKYFIRQRLSKSQIENEIDTRNLIFFRNWLKDKLSSYQQYKVSTYH